MIAKCLRFFVLVLLNVPADCEIAERRVLETSDWSIDLRFSMLGSKTRAVTFSFRDGSLSSNAAGRCSEERWFCESGHLCCLQTLCGRYERLQPVWQVLHAVRR